MYDVVVVGAGSGGLTAARQAASFGARTLLVERLARLGGDCTWYGCVPSKALIRCARARHEALRAADLGVVVKEVHCDWRMLVKGTGCPSGLQVFGWFWDVLCWIWVGFGPIAFIQVAGLEF